MSKIDFSWIIFEIWVIHKITHYAYRETCRAHIWFLEWTRDSGSFVLLLRSLHAFVLNFQLDPRQFYNCFYCTYVEQAENVQNQSVTGLVIRNYCVRLIREKEEKNTNNMCAISFLGSAKNNSSLLQNVVLWRNSCLELHNRISRFKMFASRKKKIKIDGGQIENWKRVYAES